MWNYIPLPMEGLRIGMAIAILTLASYFDIKHNRNIPDKLAYSSLALAFLINLYPNPLGEVSLYGILQALFLFIFTYFFYKKGFLGGAEVYIIPALALLLPFPPSFTGIYFSLPFILFIIIYAGLFFAVFATLYFAYKLIKTRKFGKIDYSYGLLALLFIIFTYYYTTSPLFSPFYFYLIFILFLSAIFFGMFREGIEKLLVGKVKVDEAEEEVFAREFADKEEQEIIHETVISKKDIEKLKERGIKEVTVYAHLLPFNPFLLLGLLAALYYAPLLFPF